MKFNILTIILMLFCTFTLPTSSVYSANINAKSEMGSVISTDEDMYTLTFSGVKDVIEIKSPMDDALGNPLGYIYKLQPGTYISLTSKADGVYQSITSYDNKNNIIGSFSMADGRKIKEKIPIKNGVTLLYKVDTISPEISYFSVDIKIGKDNIYCYFLVSSDDENDTLQISKRIINAKPTSSTVKINGKVQAFQSFYVDGHNYFKLRDLAAALQNAGKPFDIVYNVKTGDIDIYSGKPYTFVGGELAPPTVSTSETGIATPSTLYLDGAVLNLVSYLIKGNNYYMLRDMGKALDFGVQWVAENNSILIDTSQPYTE